MPLLVRTDAAADVAGGKRRLAVILAVVAVCLGAFGAWSALRPGSYDVQRAGCVTATIPSSTGGGLLHECGAGAQALCKHALRHRDSLSLRIRPACRQAGLG